MINTIKDVLKARRTSPELCRGDLLDQAMNDMNTEKYLTEDFIINFFIAVLFASLESIFKYINVSFQVALGEPFSPRRTQGIQTTGFSTSISLILPCH